MIKLNITKLHVDVDEEGKKPVWSRKGCSKLEIFSIPKGSLGSRTGEGDEPSPLTLFYTPHG